MVQRLVVSTIYPHIIKTRIYAAAQQHQTMHGALTLRLIKIDTNRNLFSVIKYKHIPNTYIFMVTRQELIKTMHYRALEKTWDIFTECRGFQDTVVIQYTHIHFGV